jgi:DNA invertase Pin-like site-specific DNA recombinase
MSAKRAALVTALRDGRLGYEDLGLLTGQGKVFRGAPVDELIEKGRLAINKASLRRWFEKLPFDDRPAFLFEEERQPVLPDGSDVAEMTGLKAKVDIVVFYKIDRLSRSLADFARMVDVFDRHRVSFSAVTQQINSATSMGQLMLNVLLSFAQFEREVTGERIRDKIAASKAKGMWMGGPLPLGYDVRDRLLVINEKEADLVRRIFDDFVSIRSATLIAKAYVTEGALTKGGKRFTKQALYKMLHNRMYLGEIVHKGQSFPGQHQAIITRTQ